MADKKTLTLDDLPTIEQLTNKSLRRGQKMIEAGRSPADVAQFLQFRNVQVRQFFMQNFELLEKRDKVLMDKTTKRLVKINLAALVPAIGLNIGLARLTARRIFDLPFLARCLIRTSIFGVPIYYSASYSHQAYTRISLYLEDKYADRIPRFTRTGDPSMINPYYEQEAEEQ